MAAIANHQILAERRSPAFVTSDPQSSDADDAGVSMTEMLPETPRQAMCRELKERVARGEYWMDLDFLACLLVDSGAVRSHLDDDE